MPGPDRSAAILAFLAQANRLKTTLRSAETAPGRYESVAEHSWSVALLTLLAAPDLPDDLDRLRLLELALVHDLGEAISGDVPAPLQTPGDDRTARERRDLATLTADLPADLQTRIRDLWEEYAAAETPEARYLKGLDKIETVTHQATAPQAGSFDHDFNLGYARSRTDAAPELQALRAAADALTRAEIARRGG